MILDRQPHLQYGLDTLDAAARTRFLDTLNKYGPETLEAQRALIGAVPSLEGYRPLETVAHAGNNEALGWRLIGEGKVGCVVLAGGQGTRLGHDAPKGTLSVGPVTSKSLFQRLAERVVHAGNKAGRALPLAIMTSPQNDAATQMFFQAHAHFGLKDLSFFTQSTLPFLDEQGNWFLEAPGVLAEGPDGNGNALLRFYHSGLWEEWQRKGVAYVNVIFIDNPLADPFDAELIGFAAHHTLDIGMKVIERQSLHEQMGIVALHDDKLRVIEYSEVAPDASASYRYGSPGQFCYALPFIPSLRDISPKWHCARKTASHLGRSIPVYKYETFQFDLLAHAKHSAALLYPRHRCYAPLKNKEGDKSPATVREALLQWDKEVYTALSGLSAPPFPFELDPAFYYPTPELQARMRGYVLPCDGYISSAMVI